MTEEIFEICLFRKLTKNEIIVLNAVLFYEFKQVELARYLKLSQSRIYQIYHHALEKLRHPEGLKAINELR